MARALSVVLRRRVVGAIEVGLSCRAAAERFGVSPSSAIRWRAQEQREGDVTPKRQGGDRHSHRIEAFGVCPLSTWRTIHSRPFGVSRAFLWMSIRFSGESLKLRNLSFPSLDRVDNLLKAHS